MQRTFFITGIILLLIILLLGSLFFWKSRPVTSGPTVRAVSSWTTTPGRPVDVSLRLSADDLPACPAKQEAVDAILVLDRSGSMEQSIAEAGKAASAFAKALGQSDDNRVALIAFNDHPDIITPLSEETDQLQASALNLPAEGGTDIASALAMSSQVLGNVQNPHAVQAIILLSDGGSDPTQALNQAQILKDDGVYLIIIGLKGDDYDPKLLRQLATSSTDFYTVENLPDLTQLYRNLAHSLTHVAATNITLQQPYLTDKFTLVQSDTLPSTVETAPNMLLWTLGALTSNGAELTYHLKPSNIGWHDIAGEVGALSMVTCTGVPLNLELSPGPKVFVSPIPPILWLIFPFLLLLPLLIAMWFKRKPKTSIHGMQRSVEPFQFDFSEKRMPSTSFDDVPPLEYSSSSKLPVQYPQALIIGLGESGEKILGEYRRIVTKQNNGIIPDSIRLLSIRADLPGSRLQPFEKKSGKAALDSDEQLILSPDLDRVTDIIRRGDHTWAYLDWWAEHTPDDAGRAGARMALFADFMEGEGRSLIWNALKSRLDGLQSPLVYVLASLALPEESGMALDLPHFVRQVTDHAGIETRRVITMFYLQRTGIHAKEVDDVNLNTYAAIRELQRLLLREPWYYEYYPGVGLVGSTDTTPIDACYLLDGVSEHDNMENLPEEKAFYPTVADTLVTLLSSDVTSWHQDYINKLPEQARKTENLIGYPTVSSLSCSVVQYPLAELKQVSKYHFLMDLLYGGLHGQEALGLVRLDPGQSDDQEIKLDARAGGLSGYEYVIQFLKSGGKPNRHPLMAIVAQILNGQTISANDLAFYKPGMMQIDGAFRYALRDELVVLLNGTGSSAIENRSGKLGASIAFLQALAEALNQADSGVSQHVAASGELTIALRERILNWKRTTENTLDGIKEWKEFFIGKKEAERLSRRSRRRRQRSSGKKHESLDSIYQKLQAEWRHAQEELEISNKPLLRQLVEWDEEKQNQLYQRYLGAELLKKNGISALQPLENIMARIGWRVQAIDYDDIVSVRLVILPPHISAQEASGFQYSYRPEQREDIWCELVKLSEYYLPQLDSEQLGERVKSLGIPALTEMLLKAQYPLAKHHKERLAALGVEPKRQLVLTLAEPELQDKVKTHISKNLNIAIPLEVKTSRDPYRCSLVGMADIIPFDGFEAIEEARLDYVSDPLVHIFRAEQRATRLEKEWYTHSGQRHYFHPRFVRLLENEQLMISLALAHFYKMLIIEPHGTKKRAVLHISDDRDHQEIIIAQAEELSLFDVFSQAYRSWLKESADHLLSHSKWEFTHSRIQEVMRLERGSYDDLYAYADDFGDEIKRRLQQDEIDVKRKTRAQRRRPWIQDVDIFLWLVVNAEKRKTLEF